jgi:hypothetical protein
VITLIPLDRLQNSVNDLVELLRRKFQAAIVDKKLFLEILS